MLLHIYIRDMWHICAYEQVCIEKWIAKVFSNHNCVFPFECHQSNFHTNFSFIFRLFAIFISYCSLPIPWLLYGIVFQAPVEVNSCGMICSIAILFMMLLFVIASIACFQWRMNKGLGVTMFLLYFVFVAISLMFEYKHLTCPF